ncbi:protein pleiotropic regulatory locus 1 [Histomonas meleagridis]|uniref:protein pleiotropic regulatory locus 1 n=1 Tax=Histomonas meleagridis TaxID=135588 RepID=UPI00355AA2B9|nr:protein pleiotropic regulatory locus 1 [Histomonas meleagridis]KAH0799997.1 protein pleiotropic regulatory locus 1 [Histomonas meleagridis]
MDWEQLILKNKAKTNLLFEASEFQLPKTDTREIRLGKDSFHSNRVSNFLPSVSKPQKVETIQPTQVIDLRPERGKEHGETFLPAAKPHRQWYNYTTLTGHNAWVKAVTVDPSNEFFITGSIDRMLKIWDLAKAELRMTLTGHIGAIQDLEISNRSPYLFSCCDAKCVYCWDLNQNSIVRDFHGHLSGVYCLSLHPTIDIFATGSRDATCRIWDIRTRDSVFVLEGHDLTVFDVKMQDFQPNVLTSSADATIRAWDLRNGSKCLYTLTRHKKTVRALALHPKEWSFASASQDAIFHWNGEESKLFKEFKYHKSIKNALAINQDDVFVSAGDDGTIKFWDWGSGQCFQEVTSIPHPGSLDCENGIFDCAFDMTGTRLITCEADKTIKLWREFDENGNPY